MNAQAAIRQRETNRKKRFPFYLLLSCIIHGVLILLITFFFAQKFARQKSEPSPTPEVTLEITQLDKKDRPVVDAKNITDKAPENAPFQSDQNSKTSSELPPDGTLALPSQQGVDQTALELETQKYTAGEKRASQAGNQAPAQPPSPATPPVPPLPFLAALDLTPRVVDPCFASVPPRWRLWLDDLARAERDERPRADARPSSFAPSLSVGPSIVLSCCPCVRAALTQEGKPREYAPDAP